MSYADVNGISLYYEEHGSGQPLVLLHGGYGTGEMFGAIMPSLASGRRVITVDLQGHGRTADVDRPLRFQTMGDDIAALIRHLGLGQGPQSPGRRDGLLPGRRGGPADRDPASGPGPPPGDRLASGPA